MAAREPVASRRHPTANRLFNGKLPAGAVAGCDHVPRKIKSTERCAAFRLPCFCELRVYVIADSVRTVLSRKTSSPRRIAHPLLPPSYIFDLTVGVGVFRTEPGASRPLTFSPVSIRCPTPTTIPWSECSARVGGPIRQIQFAVDLSATQDVSAGNVEDRLLCRHARAEEQQKQAELCARSIELGFRAHYRAPAD